MLHFAHLSASWSSSRMNWCLLVWKVLLPVSGAITGRILTVEKISAVEGTSATLQCHLFYTTAEITQVTWKRNDCLLAIHDSAHGSYIVPFFSKKVNLSLGYGITLLSLTTNDTGKYYCDFYTFPDGIYKGYIFLEVTEVNFPGDLEAEALDSSPLKIPFAVMISVIILTAVIILVIWADKSKTFRTNSANCYLMRRSSSKQNELRPSSPGSCLQLQATPRTINQAYQQENNIEEFHEYSNVLSYRSPDSFNLLVKTG